MGPMTISEQETWVPTDTFANRLVLIRRELGMTVKAAAEATGIHYATWSTWENGSKPADIVHVVTNISEALNVDRDWLMWGKTNNSPRQGPGIGELPRLDSNQEPSD